VLRMPNDSLLQEQCPVLCPALSIAALFRQFIFEPFTFYSSLQSLKQIIKSDDSLVLTQLICGDRSKQGSCTGLWSELQLVDTYAMMRTCMHTYTNNLNPQLASG
jgi:hypothetical protein